MAFLEVSGVPCGAPSHLTIPLTGRAWADVHLAAQQVPWSVGDQVTVNIQGGDAWQMTVERLGPSGGFLRARLVGGAGGLSQEIGSRWYRDAPAGQILRDILSECGETPGELELPDAPLPAWMRPAGPAHEALRALMMRYPSHNWRLTPAGQVEAKVPAWPEHAAELRIESEDAAHGHWTCSVSPSLTAGMRVTMKRAEGEELSKRATRVTHQISSTYAYPSPQVHLRTIVGTGDGQDSGVAGLEVAVQRAVRWVDYLALYDCTVLRDHGDHTLDLRPMHPLLPEMTKVRLVQPLPGTRVKLQAGSQVLLSFLQGDPSRPVVLHYGQAILEKLEIITGLGQTFLMEDDRGEKHPDDQLYQRPHVRVTDAAGQTLELWAQPGAERVSVTDRAGQTVTLDPVAGTVLVQGNAAVNIEAPLINVNGGQVVLAGGGPPVARVGDQVQVNVSYGSSAGTHTGTIISGSPRVVSG